MFDFQIRKRFFAITLTFLFLALTGSTLLFFNLPVTQAHASMVSTAAVSSASGACQVSYSVDQWSGGFTTDMTITNTGSTDINGWSLVFTFPDNQHVSVGWDAHFSQSGNQVTVTDVSRNATIPVNGSVNLGFLATWHGSNSTPTSFILNGVPCSIA
jgi:hypothetical protein